MTKRSDDTKVSLFGGWLTVKYSPHDAVIAKWIWHILKR